MNTKDRRKFVFVKHKNNKHIWNPKAAHRNICIATNKTLFILHLFLFAWKESMRLKSIYSTHEIDWNFSAALFLPLVLSLQTVTFGSLYVTYVCICFVVYGKAYTETSNDSYISPNSHNYTYQYMQTSLCWQHGTLNHRNSFGVSLFCINLRVVKLVRRR